MSEVDEGQERTATPIVRAEVGGVAATPKPGEHPITEQDLGQLSEWSTKRKKGVRPAPGPLAVDAHIDKLLSERGLEPKPAARRRRRSLLPRKR